MLRICIDPSLSVSHILTPTHSFILDLLPSSQSPSHSLSCFTSFSATCPAACSSHLPSPTSANLSKYVAQPDSYSIVYLSRKQEQPDLLTGSLSSDEFTRFVSGRRLPLVSTLSADNFDELTGSTKRLALLVLPSSFSQSSTASSLIDSLYSLAVCSSDGIATIDDIDFSPEDPEEQRVLARCTHWFQIVTALSVVSITMALVEVERPLVRSVLGLLIIMRVLLLNCSVVIPDQLRAMRSQSMLYQNMANRMHRCHMRKMREPHHCCDFCVCVLHALR